MKLQCSINNETEWLFYHLSLKNFNYKSEVFPFYVPDTLVYKVSCVPEIWYFTNKAGAFCRKYRHSVTQDSVETAIPAKYGRNPVGATIYRFDEPLPNQIRIQSEYLSPEGLTEYFSVRTRQFEILQGFVLPQGKSNFLIEASFSPFGNRCFVEKKTNTL